jgi:tetratricopeptide (TPR) repeat protein
MDYASLYNLIYCFEFLEQYEEAISFLNTFLEQNPYCEVAWHQIGKMYVELDMYKEALASFEFAIIADDKFTGAYFEKGRVLEKLGRFNEAIESYETSFEWDSPSSSSYLRIGLCHQKLGNYQLAETQFFKAIHEDPMYDQGWLALTKLFFIQGDYARAQEYINKALTADSENASFWKRAAIIYQALGNPSQADYAFKQCVELGNYELNTFLKWAEILLELKSYDSAYEVLEQGIEFYPDQSSLLYFMAGIYALRDQKESAQTTMCKALRLDPSGAEYFYLYFEELSEVDWLKAYLEANKRTFSS